jgi:hypothetical protein
MIGIYKDSFLTFLKDNSHDVTTSRKNIIMPCPWCELNERKKYYKLYISLELPIFHCFRASCEQSGNIKKLVQKISGSSDTDQYVDPDAFSNLNKPNVFEDKEEQNLSYILPPVDPRKFPYKAFYLNKRLKSSSINVDSIKGLIFDIELFLNLNSIPITQSLFRMKDYLHTNFIGFLSEHQSRVIFRNIDDSQEFRYFKLELKESNLLDYYKIQSGNPNSKQVVLSEGIFDIFSEHIFDETNTKSETNFYASVFSSKYQSLIHSIAFHEQIFRQKVIILSDNNIPLQQYKKLKFYNNHCIDSLTVYYNELGKDFGSKSVRSVKYIV